MHNNQNKEKTMFKDQFSKYRKARHLTQTDMADILNVSRGAIGNWESGSRIPDTDMLHKIADYFRVTIDDLLGHSSAHDPADNWVPVIGDVAAGIPLDAIEDTDPDDWEQITEAMARNGRHIALRINGSSMEPRMRKGDVVIVRIQEDAEDGDIVIVKVNGDEATCKKIKKSPDGVTLISLNPAFDPIFYSSREVEELPVRILGRVVELRAKF